MRKESHKIEGDANAFKTPGWFRKLWSGTLFGSRKDKLILRILKLGGREILVSRCGLQLHFDRDPINVGPAPSMKQLQVVLRKAEAEWDDTKQSMTKGALMATLMQAHPEDYNIKRAVIPSKTGPSCGVEMWTPKQPSVKSPKKTRGSA